MPVSARRDGRRASKAGRGARQIVQDGRERGLLERPRGERGASERGPRQRLDFAVLLALVGQSRAQLATQQRSQLARQCRRRRHDPLRDRAGSELAAKQSVDRDVDVTQQRPQLAGVDYDRALDVASCSAPSPPRPVLSVT